MIVFVGWTADYDKAMIHQLAKIFDVSHISIPEKKFLFHLNRMSGFILVRMLFWLKQRMNSKKIVWIFKDSDGYGYLKNISTIKGSKILILRNIVSADFINLYKKSFDKLYTFDRGQSKAYVIDYMEQIFPYESLESLSHKDNGKCYFLGLDKGRIEIIEQLALIFKQQGINHDFNVIRDESSCCQSQFYVDNPIPYEQNILLSSQYKFLLEINQKGQTGITLRTLESLFLQKKLITNNRYIMEYDFYDETRIFVFEDACSWDNESFKKFIFSDYQPVDEDILNQYKASTFFGKVIKAYDAEQ